MNPEAKLLTTHNGFDIYHYYCDDTYNDFFVIDIFNGTYEYTSLNYLKKFIDKYKDSPVIDVDAIFHDKYDLIGSDKLKPCKLICQAGDILGDMDYVVSINVDNKNIIHEIYGRGNVYVGNDKSYCMMKKIHSKHNKKTKLKEKIDDLNREIWYLEKEFLNKYGWNNDNNK